MKKDVGFGGETKKTVEEGMNIWLHKQPFIPIICTYLKQQMLSYTFSSETCIVTTVL